MTIDVGQLVYALLLLILGVGIRGAFNRVNQAIDRVNGHDTRIAIVETKQTKYDEDISAIRKSLNHIENKLDGKEDKK